jgi:hypothetical protein
MIRQRSRPLTGAVLAATVAALTAACGSSSPSNTVAAVGSTTPTSSAAAAPAGAGAPSATDNAKLVRYSECMRSHGVPGFPDPSGGRLLLQVTKGSSTSLNPDSPQFKAAAQACKALAPAGARGGQTASSQLQAQALKYSSCMRSHGVPKFPDPTFSGGGVRMQLHGIDPNAPAFKQAQQACASLAPGGTP